MQHYITQTLHQMRYLSQQVRVMAVPSAFTALSVTRESLPETN